MKKIIFVVDDSETNLIAAEAALEDYYIVITIPSGKEAIALLEKVRPRLILLDIEMPGMNGFEVLEQLRADKRFIDIPVMFLTGRVDDKIKSRALSLGVSDVVIKPFNAPILLEQIQKYAPLRRR